MSLSRACADLGELSAPQIIAKCSSNMRGVVNSSLLAVSLCERFGEYAPDGVWLFGQQPPRRKRPVPAPGSIVTCPVQPDMDFCIDTMWSDDLTCLHPMPHLIKRCYDVGCLSSEFGQERMLGRKEDTYCKDYMGREGRFCQWSDVIRCSCSDEQIVYVNAIAVPQGEPIPEGYSKAGKCAYPTNNIKRYPNGKYEEVPVMFGEQPPTVPPHPKLLGDPNWKDPFAEPTATPRPAPRLAPRVENPNSVSGVSVAILVLVAAVF